MRGRVALPVERLWTRYIVIETGCWEYTGAKAGNGYGRFRLRGVNMFAHRAAYEIAVGPIPDGMYVCHRCDNKPCINPDHLFLGTPRDNFIDAYVKGRISPEWGVHRGIHPERQPRGAAHAMAKLTEVQAAEIIRRLLGGERQTHLAREYGVSVSLVHLIAKRQRWAHLWQALGVEAAA
jgi:hypothetical protein